MPLTSGVRLGPYEITGALGAGGMGEVYRATDTKLGREVAIKILPAGLATDTDRLARFEREAKLLAALDHPHIAGVYGLDENDGTLYLAMELVEGETLEQRLTRGALPVEDALRLALEIADALEAAHGKGVVHRDLKPANVMLTRDGQVKVLDFGLAKAFSGPAGEASPAHSPALSLAMTQQGLVLGTAGYMSPEQASGQATDQRADVWAFGVVLYEMLTGLPLFRGESVPHILADVLKTEPDWARLPPRLHPRLKLLLERCLTKRPRSRLHAIADARIEIEAVLADPAGATPAAPAQAGRARKGAALAAAGVFAATAAVAAVAGWLVRPAPPAPAPGPVVRFSIPFPSPSLTPASMVAVSRDGTRIAYVDDRLYVRDLGEAEARAVAGTAETLAVTQPAFSPDGQWLAYVHVVGPAGPFLVKRVPVSGGAPLTLYTGQTIDGFPQGLSWPAADALLFANSEGVVRLPANGGATEVLVARMGEERLYSPQLLPDGDTVLFTRLQALPGPSLRFDSAQVVVQSVGQDDRQVVWNGGSAARYVPSGHLLYAQDRALFAMAFDANTRATRGGPVPLLQGLGRSTSGNTDTANFAISDTGTLALVAGATEMNVAGSSSGSRVETTLAWVDRNGREEPLPLRPGDYSMARVSPDGTRIAVVIGAALTRNTLPSIWIYDLRTENLSLLTADPAVHDGPVWSADGNRIYFRVYEFNGDPAAAVAGAEIQGNTITGGSIYAIDLPTGEVTRVGASTPEFQIPMPWALSPDGQTLAVVNALGLEDVNFGTLSLATGEFTPLLGGPGEQNYPSFSADGAWLAYMDRPASGAGEINIRPFPAVSRTRIPVGPGELPVFARDGSELFLFDGQGIVAVPVSYEPTLRVGAPRRLFASDAYLWNLFGRTWDPDPSGERFIMIRAPGSTSASPAGPAAAMLRIDVVLNWLEELKRRVPTAP